MLTTDRDTIRRLFTGDPALKRHGNDLLRFFVGERSLLVLEPSEHLSRRKMLLPPFHGERVRGYARLMEDLVVAEIDRLKVGQTVSMQSMAQGLTLDLILQAVLGVRDVALHRRLREIFDGLVTPLSNLVALIPALAHRSRWNRLAEPYWRLQDELDALLMSHIAATRRDSRLDQREDILALMVLARNDQGEGLSDEELRDELVTLITAGHETTATAIAWGVELLSHHPAVMVSAREAGDAYLEALLKEILRLHAPVPIGAARHVLEPFAIHRWTIPSAVTILVDSYGVHHDPELYPEPYAFRPERFLEASPDGYAFLPFGGGAHRCLGSALAMLEIKIVLREVLTRLELQPACPQVAAPARRAVTLAPRGGAQVRILAKHLPLPSRIAMAASSTAA